jgi:hypothetical protein
MCEANAWLDLLCHSGLSGSQDPGVGSSHMVEVAPARPGGTASFS